MEINTRTGRLSSLPLPPPYIDDSPSNDKFFLSIPLPLSKNQNDRQGNGDQNDRHGYNGDQSFRKWYLSNHDLMDEYLPLFDKDPWFTLSGLGNINYEMLEQIGIRKKVHIKYLLKKFHQHVMEKKHQKKRPKRKHHKDSHHTPPTSIDDY